MAIIICWPQATLPAQLTLHIPSPTPAPEFEHDSSSRLLPLARGVPPAFSAGGQDARASGKKGLFWPPPVGPGVASDAAVLCKS